MTAAAGMWAAAGRLARARRVGVLRDDGSTTWRTVPSLLDQAFDALLGGGGERRGGARWGTRSERAPVDLDLSAVCGMVAATVAGTLRARNIAPSKDPNRRVLQVCGHVATWEPDGLSWWAGAFDGWSGLIEARLNLAPHRPRSVRLRDSACPACGARQVMVDACRVPALAIDFVDGFVRAATCQGCGASWWRGEGLCALADLLGGAA